MRKGLRKIGLGLVAVGLSIALLLTGTIPVCEAGPDEMVVRIGLPGVFTGAIATLGSPWGEGILDYARYINEERGGIDGVQIDIVWEETKADIGRSIIAHRRFREAGVVEELYMGSSQVEALAPTLQRDQIPTLWEGGITQAMITKPLRWVFALAYQMETQVPLLVDWLERTNQMPEGRPLKIGLIIYDYSSSWATLEGARYYADRVGYEVVGYEVVPFLGCVDSTTEWLRLAAKKPDWVLDMVLASSAVVTTKDAVRLGIREKGIKIISGMGAMDESIARVVGKDAENWLTITPMAAPSDVDQPMVVAGCECARKYRNSEAGTWYLIGWTHAMIGIEAIRLAIEKVGFENLSGRAVRDGLASIKDFDTGIVGRVTVTEAEPWALRYYRIYQIQQGRLMAFSDWYPATVIWPLELE